MRPLKLSKKRLWNLTRFTKHLWFVLWTCLCVWTCCNVNRDIFGNRCENMHQFGFHKTVIIDHRQAYWYSQVPDTLARLFLSSLSLCPLTIWCCCKVQYSQVTHYKCIAFHPFCPNCTLPKASLVPSGLTLFELCPLPVWYYQSKHISVFKWPQGI